MAKEIIHALRCMGHYGSLTLRSDGEPALVAIQHEAQKAREAETLLENSPVGDSRANGVAERAVQSVAEHFMM